MATAFALEQWNSIIERGTRRASRRNSVALPVLVAVLGQSHRASLVNLSQGGALIETDAQLYPGDRIDFRCGSIEVVASVLRNAGNRYGLKFETEIPDKDVREQMLRASFLSDRRNAREGTLSAV